MPVGGLPLAGRGGKEGSPAHHPQTPAPDDLRPPPSLLAPPSLLFFPCFFPSLFLNVSWFSTRVFPMQQQQLCQPSFAPSAERLAVNPPFPSGRT